MSRAPEKFRFVFRYVFGFMALVALASLVVVVSFYFAYDADRDAHKRITAYHVESTTQAERLRRECQSLLRLLGYDVPSIAELAHAGDPAAALGPDTRGILKMMAAMVEELRDLYREHGGSEYAATLDRIEERYRRVEYSILRGDPVESSRQAILMLDLALEQLYRQHTITADALYPDADTLLARATPYASLIGAILVVTGTFAWIAMFLLRRSVARQVEMEHLLAKNAERMYHVDKLESLGRLVGGIAHDFNNLLTAILGQVSLLMSRETDERSRQGLAQIQEAGRQAASLTRQLLNFGRPQLVKVRPVDLNDVIGSTREMLARIIGEDVQLQIDCAEDLYPVELDPHQLQQVVINLAINARDAMPGGGLLSITTTNIHLDSSAGTSVAPAGRYAKITVTDSGTGMDENTLEHIFEPYFTTKKMGKGTGLGLSTAYGIIRAAGGYIHVSSRLNEGTRVEILLPRSAAPAAANEGPTNAADLSGNETILVVEDEKQIRDFLEEGLGSLGYRVVLAADASEGLESCDTRNRRFDVILADVILPGMNGAEFLALAFQIQPQATAILMSGYTDDVLERTGLDRSDIPLINKPFEIDDIALLIRERITAKNSDTAAALAS